LHAIRYSINNNTGVEREALVSTVGIHVIVTPAVSVGLCVQSFCCMTSRLSEDENIHRVPDKKGLL